MGIGEFFLEVSKFDPVLLRVLIITFGVGFSCCFYIIYNYKKKILPPNKEEELKRTDIIQITRDIEIVKHLLERQSVVRIENSFETHQVSLIKVICYASYIYNIWSVATDNPNVEIKKEQIDDSFREIEYNITLFVSMSGASKDAVEQLRSRLIRFSNENQRRVGKGESNTSNNPECWTETKKSIKKVADQYKELYHRDVPLFLKDPQNKK